ncbi:MAG: hypothetical protein ABF479_00370 [Gluconacetobacter sp.]
MQLHDIIAIQPLLWWICVIGIVAASMGILFALAQLVFKKMHPGKAIAIIACGVVAIGLMSYVLPPTNGILRPHHVN